MNEVAMNITYEIWMKSFMPCRARMMIVSSWIEPVRKKAKTSAGTLYTDGNWCEEDQKCAIITLDNKFLLTLCF